MRPFVVFATVGWIAAIAGGVGAIALRRLDPAPILANNFGFGDLSLVGFEVLGVAFASVGAVLMLRRPGNAVGWLMVIIGAGNALAGFTAAATYSAAARSAEVGDTTVGIIGWFAALFSTMGGLILGLGFIFPTGRGHTPAWDRFVRLATVPLLIGLTLPLLQPGPLNVFPTVENPFAVGPDLRGMFGLRVSPIAAFPLMLLFPLLTASMVTRYRMADAVERHQLKWFVVSMCMSVAGIGFAGSAAILSGDPPGEAGLAVFGFAGALVPVAIGFAILRYRLYEIDRIISRTIAYTVVTGVLATTFGGTILLLQAILSTFTQGQTIAVAASTLAVYALFQPVLRRVRRAVDRRFDRARYDAERTAAAFSERLRDEVDMERVTSDLTMTTGVALGPASIGIWIRQREAGR